MSKARLVIAVVTVEKRSVSEVARTYGAARSWVYALLARYRAEGEAAFEPRSRRPKTSPTAISQDTVDLIIRLRKELSGQGLDAGPHTIAWHLEHHHQVTVSVATALSPAECMAILDALHCERFADTAPAEVWAILLDEGVYLGSVSTFYRVLRQAGESRERRRQAGDGPSLMIGWYSSALAWLPRRIGPWAQRTGFRPGELEVRDLGYRWGSLGKNDRLNIHWAVMQLPVSLLDYVLVHELAHIGQPCHAPAFWATVQRALPDHDQRRARLATAGTSLWIGQITRCDTADRAADAESSTTSPQSSAAEPGVP